MPETIDLGNGHTAEIRTELNGADERDWYVKRDRLMRANGTGTPSRAEPDPDRPAVMRVTPAIAPELTIEDTFALLDWLTARLLVSSTMPGLLPWKEAVPERDGEPAVPGTRDGLDLDVLSEIDKVVGEQQRRIQGLGPKRQKTSGISASTLPSDAPAPRTESAQQP